MKNRRSCRCLLLACLFWLTGASVHASDPPEGLIEDEWYVVKIQNAKCGYMHATTTRVGDKVNTKSHIVIEIARGTARVKMAMEQTHQETLSGEPLSFRHTQSLGEVPQVVSGTVIDGKTVRVVTEQLGSRTENTYPWDPEVKFAWGTLLEQRARGLKPGTKFTLKTYEPSLRPDAPVETEFHVSDKQRIDVLGKKRDLIRLSAILKITSDKLPMPMEIPTESWVDDEARPVITNMDMGIMKMTMYLSNKEEALAGGAPPEMFLDTLIKASGRIDPRARQLRLRLRVPEGGQLPTLPETGMQKFKRVSEREGILTVRRMDWEAIRKSPGGKPDAAMKPYLKASSVLDINDSRIKRLARRAVRGCSDAAQKADKLRQFVTDYITDKNMNVGFATATEVARNRKGDCTEHGVLLAALARAAGLPARGVGGIVAVPGGPSEKGSGTLFGYHMWTQVFLAGQWVDVDAALRQTDCDPTHIALNVIALNEEGMLDPVMSLMPLLGRLEIESLPAGK